LRGEVASFRGEVVGLRSEVVGLRGEVASFRGKVVGLRSEVAGLRDEVALFRGKVAGCTALRSVVLRGVRPDGLRPLRFRSRQARFRGEVAQVRDREPSVLDREPLARDAEAHARDREPSVRRALGLERGLHRGVAGSRCQLADSSLFILADKVVLRGDGDMLILQPRPTHDHQGSHRRGDQEDSGRERRRRAWHRSVPH
jgi:hypothetical protein